MIQVKIITGAISTNDREYSVEERLNSALCELQDFDYPIKSVSFQPIGNDAFGLCGVGMIVYDNEAGKRTTQKRRKNKHFL